MFQEQYRRHIEVNTFIDITNMTGSRNNIQTGMLHVCLHMRSDLRKENMVLAAHNVACRNLKLLNMCLQKFRKIMIQSHPLNKFLMRNASRIVNKHQSRGSVGRAGHYQICIKFIKRHTGHMILQPIGYFR